MKRNLLWRGLLILASILLSLAFLYPPKEKINLGLDLQGGMQLLLQVHTEDALRAETDADMARLVDQAKEQKVTGLAARRTGDTTFAVSGAAPDVRSTLTDIGEKFLPRWDVRQGDDLVFTMNQQSANEVRNGA